jgi:hypothetical protein
MHCSLGAGGVRLFSPVLWWAVAAFTGAVAYIHQDSVTQVRMTVPREFVAIWQCSCL